VESFWFWSAALLLSRWRVVADPLLWRFINPKTLPAGPTCGKDVDRHRGILVSRECAAIVGESKMMPFLILTRAAIIGWTTIAVLPLEIAFDAVERELKRQGVEL